MRNNGVALGAVAYLIWGFAALYWIQTRPVSSVDLVAHRVVWSAPVLLIALIVLGRLRTVIVQFSNLRLLGILACSTLMQAINWGIFLWAITNERASEASLGYFLLPLINVALGIFIFRERIDRAQTIALVLASLGMLLLIWENRGLPWVALGVSCSFAVYGVIRKAVGVEALEGLFIEIVLLLPFGLGWLWWQDWGGLGQYGAHVDTFLLGAGVMTVVPLVCYVAASRMTALSALGLVFYLGPTCQLFVAVCIFGEPMTKVQFASFFLVWLGLAFVVLDTLRRSPSVRALPHD